MVKARIKKMHEELNKKANHPKKNKEPRANVPRGERGGFIRQTITLSPDMLSRLKQVGVQRKSLRMIDTDVSSLIREAVGEWMKKQCN